MYFPYLRGKQFELLAIKELAPAIRASGAVHPIIEPVRDIDAGPTLLRNLAALVEHRLPCTVIINPRVGDMKGVDKTENILTQLEPLFAANRNMRIGVLLTSEQEIQQLIAILGRATRLYRADLIYGTAVISEESMQRLAELCDIEMHLAEDKNSVRRYRRIFTRPATAILKDSFAKQKQERNQDYYPLEESIFTEDNIFFAEDGYEGFGDYQTIGEAFKEGGTMPRVVAIHLTYQRPREEAIFIRHFCSTPNGSSADTAGKYLEALSKLVAFANDYGLSNPALDTFRSHLDKQSFPGLGVIKKLSIQNHIHVAIGALKDA
jgi:hypothetical protein